MSARYDRGGGATGALLHGELLEPCEVRESGEAFLWYCRDCGRVVLSELVFITNEGEIQCTGCADVQDLL